ncbi:MAG: precorrin-8X methylmutase [Eubacteriales bacterium]|nr:precorrin-8X methylmutase [Eubacteriales bacterium]
MRKHTLPADIERTSMRIIAQEMHDRGIAVPQEHQAVVRRVIHTTADFEYAETLRFTPNAVMRGMQALRNGVGIVTDTNMTRAGVSKLALQRFGGEVHCFMAEPAIAELAKREGTTRAVASMTYAAQQYPDAVFAVGNAPTALIRLSELIRDGLRPSLVVAVPVGFVNVVESKEELFSACETYDVPAIAAMGRKGGSTIAAAVCNALLYSAADMLDPSARGWQG